MDNVQKQDNCKKTKDLHPTDVQVLLSDILTQKLMWNVRNQM
jgi:hypothetical protein